MKTLSNLRGVNLGGWLIVEKWLTPSVFAGTDAIDEYTLSRTPGGKQRIRRHHDTFITKKDFHWLADHKVKFVRIPVGYWLFEGIDGFEPTVKYLDKAMEWAAKYSIKVLIDLHAARGSQNGFDSSGRVGKAGWFENTQYQEHTIDVLVRIAERYRDAPALWGIELLNEPTPGHGQHRILRRFHRAAYRQLRTVLRPETVVVFHDAFQPWRHLGTFWPRRRGASHSIMIDIHWYGFALNTKNMNNYLRQSSWIRRAAIRCLQLWHPVIIGEWSSVLPQRFFDAAPQSEHMELLRRNIAMQCQAYRHAAGWAYWNYKADGGGMWNYRSLIEKGIIDTN